MVKMLRSFGLLIVLAFCCKLYAIDVSQCSKTKSCVISPDGCNVTNSSCLVFTYSWNSTQKLFTFEISGGVGGGKQYAAVAFSSNGKMENSDLYYCSGKELRTGVIQVQYHSPLIQASLPSNVSSLKANTVDGVGYCLFTRTSNVVKNISGNTTNFDLLDIQYFTLQALGNITNGTLHKHAGKGVGRFSTGPYNFTQSSTNIPSTTTAPDTTATVPSSNETVDGDCNKTKGCFTSPRNCTPGTSSCMFLSWTFISSLNAFDFEVVGGTSSQYAATAFGLVNGMQDADLYYCTRTKFYSGVIQNKDKRPVVFDSLPIGISNVNVSVVDGVLRCRFRRVAAISKPISSGANHDFNLAKVNYYLLIALGTPQKNGSLNYHGETRVISETSLNLTQIQTLNASQSSINVYLVKIHALLMLVAWLSCVSIGVFVSRHFKPLWRRRSFFKQKMWFQLHRGLMLLAMLCTFAGFIVVFVAKKGYSSGAGAHPILGIIATALMVINPSMAFLRPRPESDSRPLFNWCHRYLGTLARIVSIAAMFFGVNLPLLNLPHWFNWLMIGFVALHVLFEVLLEVVSAKNGHIPGYKSVQQDASEVDREPLISLILPGEKLKSILLFVYAQLNIAILLLFIVFILLN